MEGSNPAVAANSAAKFAFFYLLSLVALIFLATSVGMILFQLINKFIADPVGVSEPFNQDSLKFAISALIIAAPIYFVTVGQINKSLFAGRLDPESGVRRWLTYLILFIASVVMIGWLIGVLNTYLNGDLTLKFGLKGLVSIVLAGSIFSYYFHDIRRDKVAGVIDKTIRWAFYGAVAVAAAALVAALFIVESPRAARDRKSDELLLNRFDQIDQSLNSYFIEKRKLPDSLEVLVQEKWISDQSILGIPGTDKKIEYKPGKDKVYELCADFKASNKDLKAVSPYYSSRWLHDAGYQCLTQRLGALPDVKAVPAVPEETKPAPAPAR